MEDIHLIWPQHKISERQDFKDLIPKEWRLEVFGILDGHGGTVVAKIVESTIIRCIFEEVGKMKKEGDAKVTKVSKASGEAY